MNKDSVMRLVLFTYDYSYYIYKDEFVFVKNIVNARQMTYKQALQQLEKTGEI